MVEIYIMNSQMIFFEWSRGMFQYKFHPSILINKIWSVVPLILPLHLGHKIIKILFIVANIRKCVGLQMNYLIVWKEEFV